MSDKLLKGVEKQTARAQAIFACGIWMGTFSRQYSLTALSRSGSLSHRRVVYQKKKERFLITIGEGSLRFSVGFGDQRWDNILEVLTNGKVIYPK